MTNEEAVRILRRIQEPEAWEPQINGAAFEALDMAIEALGQKQAAVSGDLISKQDAIDAINCDITITGRQNAELVAATIGAFVDRIKALPSAEPETAKRIVGKSRDGMTLWYQCDMCNEPVDVQDNYCRGCGRRKAWVVIRTA